MEQNGAWLEPATTQEWLADRSSPYRLCFPSGERFALSYQDALRAQKQGTPWIPERSTDNR